MGRARSATHLVAKWQPAQRATWLGSAPAWAPACSTDLQEAAAGGSSLPTNRSTRHRAWRCLRRQHPSRLCASPLPAPAARPPSAPQELDLIRLKREAKAKGGFYVEPEAKLVFVVSRRRRRRRGGGAYVLRMLCAAASPSCVQPLLRVLRALLACGTLAAGGCARGVPRGILIETTAWGQLDGRRRMGRAGMRQ